MPKTRGTALADGVLYRDGDVCIAPLPGGGTLYVWWYDPTYGGGDRRRASLGTSDLKVAIERLNAFRDSGFDLEFLKAARKGGIAPRIPDLDPLLADLMADFLVSPEHTGTYRSAASMALPTIERLFSETRISHLTPRVQQAIIGDVYARGYAPATVIHIMQFIARCVNWGAGGDDDAVIRCRSRPKIINSPYKVCKVLDVPVPDGRNWHPEPDGMAQVLALLADDEPMRRWALKMLAFASRVEAALDTGAAELQGELFHLNPDWRRQKDSKWRPSLPVPWSALAEFRTWGQGPWIEGLTVQAVGKRLRAVRESLGMPQLVASSFRDYASSALRHADIDFPVRPVAKEHRMRWLGHHKSVDISDGYGRFRPDFLVNPRVATEAFLRDLDRRSGGALFRQGPDKTPLRALYPVRREDSDEVGYRPTTARAYAARPVSDNDDDPDPTSDGIQSDVPGATRGTWVVLGTKRVSEGGTEPISGPFRQVTGKIEQGVAVPNVEALQVALALLAERGIQMFEREAAGQREMFLVAPAETLVPVCAVPDLLRLARPRLRWPKRLPGKPKIGRLKRLRPATAADAVAAEPANLPHRVSISGLHMVLAASVVFWLVRAFLALVPFLALNWPIKKIAAACAMLGVTAYCAFSGWDIAAERSLVMTLVMLGAILVDRPALSMRNLALAALIALAREPEGILGPSFQMSFGAVAGLIACAPLLHGSALRREGSGRFARAVGWMLAAVIGTLATTLVAQVATAPFATYHFQTVQPFGVVGNALTLPLVSLAVMPAAVLGILAYPFALDQPVWWAMGLAVRSMLTISTWIAGFGSATYVVPAYGASALALLACALVMLTVPASSLRWLGLVPAVLGVGLAARPDRHDLYIDREGAGAAIRDRSGRLAILGRPPAFVLEQWLKADGDGRKATALSPSPEARCDRLGCTFALADGRTVALATDKRALPEDCARADILITRQEAPPDCAAALVLDRTFLKAHGATAIRLAREGPVVTTARRPGEPVPWRATTRPQDRPAPVPRPAVAPDAIGDAEVEPGDADQ